MRPDDRDDPLDEFFRELERVMNGMMDAGRGHDDAETGAGPHVDVHEAADSVRVVADLLGVDQEDLQLTCDGETLSITATSDTDAYDERVRLPARVDEHSASASFNNGVLEVTLRKRDDSADIRLD